MHSAYNVLIVVAMAAVVVILALGLANMMKGGNANRSQMLMRARVIGQAIALALLLGALFFFGRGPGNG